MLTIFIFHELLVANNCCTSFLSWDLLPPLNKYTEVKGQIVSLGVSCVFDILYVLFLISTY